MPGMREAERSGHAGRTAHFRPQGRDGGAESARDRSPGDPDERGTAQGSATVTAYLDNVRDTAVRVGQDAGPLAAQVAMGGAGAIVAAAWDSATSVLFGAMLATWGLDMVAGGMKAIDRAGGLRGWEWDRFWFGLRKLVVATVAFGLGVVLDVLAASAGLTTQPAAAATLTLLTMSFFVSTAKSVGHFMPEVGGFLGEVAKRVPGGVVTVEQLEQEDEQRRGRPRPGGPGAREMNGTDH